MKTRNKQIRRMALAAYLAIGAGLVWGIVFGFSISIIDSMISPDVDVFDESLVFTNDNTPVIQTYYRNNSYLTSFAYRDLEEKPISISDQSIASGFRLNGPVDSQDNSFRLSWSERIRELGYSGPERWFFVRNDQPDCRGYLVGYNRESNAKIGYLGRNGFRPEEPPQEDRFRINRQMAPYYGFIQQENGYTENPINGATLVTEEGLVSVNLKRRTVKLVFKNDNILSALVVDGMPKKIEELSHTKLSTNYHPTFLLRTSDRVLLLDVGNAKEIESYLLPKQLRDDHLGFLRLDEGKALLVHEEDKRQNKLFWIDTTGKIVKQKDVVLRERRSRSSGRVNSFMMSACVPSPGIFVGIFLYDPWGTAKVSLELGYGAALGKVFQVWWPALLMLEILSTVLAILCYRRQRKYGREWTWGWVGFVLVFGLPAFLGYLAHSAWPARLPCPRCGKLAPRDREACLACHQEFPAAAPKGTEVFA